MVGERVNREIANFHLLRWRATKVVKVVKVVVCARSPILLSFVPGFPFNSIENLFRVQWMDLLNFFVFELYYTREFMLKILNQIQKTFKTS